MKKLSILFAAILVALSSFAEKGAMVLYGPLQLQVTAISPNGKWACGVLGDGTSILQGLLWNLETGEQTYLSTTDESMAWDVTDDGMVVGSYTDYVISGNGAGALVAGYYKDGVWTRYSNGNIEGVNAYGSEVSMVTPDGRVAVGYVQMGKKDTQIAPAKWVDGVLERIYEYEGAGVAYAVSNDGKYATGWGYTADVDGDKNRTIALWSDEGVEYLSPNGPTAFEAGRRFSPNGKKLLCESFGHKLVIDLETKEITEVPFVHFDVWSQHVCYIDDNGMVLGGEEWRNDATGASGRYGFVFDGENIMKLEDWLLNNHNVVINPEAHTMFRAVDMSDDQKVMAILDYPIEEESGIPYGDWSSIIIKFDQEVDYCAPVGLHAEKLRGIMKVRLTWKEPLMNASEVVGYSLYRNGEEIYTGSDGLAYIDEVGVAGNYEYTVTAWYEDENGELVESERSTAYTIEVGADIPNPVLNLASHNVNYNDLKLRWTAPESNLPAIAYYNPKAEIAGFGGGTMSFSIAIRVPLDMTANYAATHNIARIAFMPRHTQAKYTVKVLVNGVEKSSKQLETASLVLHEMNIIDLDTFVSFGANDNVLAVVEVDASGLSVGSNSIVGMEYGRVVEGADLLHASTETEFYSLNQSSINAGNGSMPVVWFLSAILAEVGDNGVADVEADVVAGYDIYRDGNKVGSTTAHTYTDLGLADGAYNYDVVVRYANGSESSKQSIAVDFAAKEESLVAVEDVEVYAGTTDMAAFWTAPVNNDASIISYARGIATGKGISLSSTELTEYTVATDYLYSFVDWYEGYTVKAIRFYPTAEAIFSVALEVNGQDVFFKTLGEMGAADGYVLNKWNNVELDVPVKIENSCDYRVKLVCSDVDPSSYPINVDDTPGVMGVSDLYSRDYNEFSSAQADGSLTGNWMLGMLVANDNTELLPVKGYNVMIDGDQANSELLTATEFKQDGLTWKDGDSHRIKVNTIYNIAGGEKEVEGANVVFNVRAGVESIEVDRVKVYPNPATAYVTVEGDVERLALVDMAGRTVAQAQGATIDVTAVAVGNYLLNIYNGDVVRTVKVVVVR